MELLAVVFGLAVYCIAFVGYGEFKDRARRKEYLKSIGTK